MVLDADLASWTTSATTSRSEQRMQRCNGATRYGDESERGLLLPKKIPCPSPRAAALRAPVLLAKKWPAAVQQLLKDAAELGVTLVQATDGGNPATKSH